MADKAVFLDRDGTIIEDPGYLNDPSQVKLLADSAGALVALKQMGYKLIVVSNQSAVARGIITEKVLDDIHLRMKELLAEKGAYVDNIYYCPYHPDGAIEKYRRESDLRKPNPGMLTKAAGQMDIDLSQSWMVGNAYSDVTAGRRAGCKTILINPPTGYKHPRPGDVKPDYQVVNLKEGVNIIKKDIYAAKSQPAETTPQIDMPIPEDAVHTEPVAAEAQEATTETLLREILQHLKGVQRANMFGDFSAMKLLAGIFQMIVPFCLLMGIWFLMAPEKDTDAIQTSLAFAAVFQLMALTFYIMQDRR